MFQVATIKIKLLSRKIMKPYETVKVSTVITFPILTHLPETVILIIHV